MGQAEANYDHSLENILFDAKFSSVDLFEHGKYAGFLNFSNQPTSDTENNVIPSRTIIFDCGTEQNHDVVLEHDWDEGEIYELTVDDDWDESLDEPTETKKGIEKRSLKSNLTYSPNSFHLDFACKYKLFF